MSASLSLDDSPEQLAAQLADAHGGEAAWLDRFAAALDRRRSGGELRRVLEIWGLSQSEAARVFGVSRQAVSKWLAHGVPAERVEAVGDLAAATDLLVRHLRRDRIPGVVRRGFAAAGGRSLIEVASDDPGEVGRHVRAMFDFSRVHA
jgi:DNA-binding transcriptional regulator YdaS (Cro superfamily)